MRILVAGGAGFIGANFVHWLCSPAAKEVFAGEGQIERVVVYDALTYAGNLANLEPLKGDERFVFERGDIRDAQALASVMQRESIDSVVNFAAETHVDRSIVNPLEFVRTNVEGTQVLLLASRDAGVSKYLQVSTDEVYGSLGPEGRFTEESPIDPSSAYSASKAGSDHLVLAAFKTHKFPSFVSRCSNNYGPYQFPEKLIPFFVTKALADEPLPLYGDGRNVRSWLHVDDHSRALGLILAGGRPGEVYNIGGAPESEKENIEVTRSILEILGKPQDLVTFVEDRAGHDRRYAVDYSKLKRELGWEPRIDFTTGLRKTVEWYRENRSWWEAIKTGEYMKFFELYYGDRLAAAK